MSARLDLLVLLINADLHNLPDHHRHLRHRHLRRARRGDGQVDMGEEATDDGENNGDDKACTSECTNNVCGDGYVLSGVEECDDGNISNTDECVDGCKLATCGDGFIQEDKEECDDGNDARHRHLPLLLQARLLRRRLRPAGQEECDDGNQSNTDACTNACKAAACGDGYVQGDEACDDGNTDDLDACSGDCATSRGASCLSRRTSTTATSAALQAPTRSAAARRRRPRGHGPCVPRRADLQGLAQR
ncbi:MAG: DUF4215 domain-containing protein [Myxococcales bacterium]|nr:DUF4215 domain-containing protein [Myxococcales bacterium]